MSEPRTEAGRALLAYLGIDHEHAETILAIEEEIAAWFCGYPDGRQCQIQDCKWCGANKTEHSTQPRFFHHGDLVRSQGERPMVGNVVGIQLVDGITFIRVAWKHSTFLEDPNDLTIEYCHHMDARNRA